MRRQHPISICYVGKRFRNRTRGMSMGTTRKFITEPEGSGSNLGLRVEERIVRVRGKMKGVEPKMCRCCFGLRRRYRTRRRLLSLQLSAQWTVRKWVNRGCLWVLSDCQMEETCLRYRGKGMLIVLKEKYLFCVFWRVCLRVASYSLKCRGLAGTWGMPREAAILPQSFPGWRSSWFHSYLWCLSPRKD